MSFFLPRRLEKFATVVCAVLRAYVWYYQSPRMTPYAIVVFSVTLFKIVRFRCSVLRFVSRPFRVRAYRVKIFWCSRHQRRRRRLSRRFCTSVLSDVCNGFVSSRCRVRYWYIYSYTIVAMSLLSVNPCRTAIVVHAYTVIRLPLWFLCRRNLRVLYTSRLRANILMRALIGSIRFPPSVQ